MSAAFLMASGAGILPPALMVAFQFKLATGKPQNLEAAAQSWSTAAEQCQKAAHDLRELVDGIPEQAWKMDDRAAYENKVADYCLQLDALHNYCMAVSYALTVLAYALFTYALFAIGVATYLDVLAVAALAIVDYPECVALAGTALTVTWVATGILATAGGIAAATMGGGASFTADYQVDHGNADADDAFKRALATGSAGAAANLAQNAANAGLAYLNRSNGNIERLPGTAHATSGSRGFPSRRSIWMRTVASTRPGTSAAAPRPSFLRGPGRSSSSAAITRSAVRDMRAVTSSSRVRSRPVPLISVSAERSSGMVKATSMEAVSMSGPNSRKRALRPDTRAAGTTRGSTPTSFRGRRPQGAVSGTR
ncbi:hypothetical protein ACFQHO_26280 [Actinomadura yumaensis]|uniref:hypothetical protein n=1 Tax=Actinomadura yumaensis TaxID=111807 RepID=UPI0036074040